MATTIVSAALAQELVRLRVSVIATPDNQVGALAAKAATRTIPIVFMVGMDPVDLGLVTSLRRPEGNATGVSLLNGAVTGKRLALLHELVPASKLIAYFINPKSRRIDSARIRERCRGAWDRFASSLR